MSVGFAGCAKVCKHVSDKARHHVQSACRRILKPVVRLLLRQGVGAGELADLCKAVYVEEAAGAHRHKSGRVNQSRVAIVTGLTRAEVKRLLAAPRIAQARYDWHRHRATRVLLGWHQDPEFRDRRGFPRELPLRGKRASFATLVRRYSGDMPVRAMLDELIASNAIVKKKRSGLVRVKAKTISTVRISAKDVASVGDRASDYLNTLVRNVNSAERPLFEATACSSSVLEKSLPLLNRDIRTRGGNFIASIEDQLHSASVFGTTKKSRSRGRPVRFGVTVFAFEDSQR
jgi:Family of unknown function (DUF6502)